MGPANILLQLEYLNNAFIRQPKGWMQVAAKKLHLDWEEGFSYFEICARERLFWLSKTDSR